VESLLTDGDVAAAAAGSGPAASRIYRILSPQVLGYLTARGVEDPEAATQEVFLTLFQKLPAVTGGAEGLRTFTFAVAHARAVDAARHRSRRPAPAAYDPETDLRTSASAEQLALDRAGGDAVGLLAALSPDQREVLSLRIIADLPIEQVARIMDRSEGSVKQLQRRALGALRKLVESQREEDSYAATC
jgi:RNA polymerase sigma factor (sigma-70 family)